VVERADEDDLLALLADPGQHREAGARQRTAATSTLSAVCSGSKGSTRRR
jgi:hypothetical protein